MEINGIETNEQIRYDSLNLSPEMLAVLEKKGYEMATPVQGGCIPFLMEGKDVVAKAPTGTGKTFAFGIPIVKHTDPATKYVSSLILAPHGSWRCKFGTNSPASARPRRGCGWCAFTVGSPSTSRSPR